MKHLLVLILFLLLYVPFLSAEFDVTEALALEGGFLFSANHLLFRPVGNVIYRIAQAAGYHERSVYVLQMVNAFCGATGVALAFVAFQKLGAARWAALAASLLLGTSFIYWSQSTDATYIVIAGTFTAAALSCAAILNSKQSLTAALGLGIFFAFAVLSWQAAIFMFPVFLWPLRGRFNQMALFVTTVVLLVGGVYVFTGVSQGRTNARDLVRWVSSHGGGNIPDWGKIDAGRIPSAAESALRSIQLNTQETSKELIRHPVSVEVWAIGSGTVCFALLAVVTVIQGILRGIHGDPRLIWLASGYLSIWPFIIWWEPMDLRWFLVPNMFLFAAAALVWSSWNHRNSVRILVFGAIAVMATITFISTVWPRHIDRGISARKAACIAGNVHSQDTVIATDWNWTADLLYFHRIQTLEVVTLGAYYQDSGKLLDHIYNELQKTQQRGRRIFIVDPSSYSEQHLNWLSEQTTFSRTDFERFSGKFAFQCEDAKFREVTSLK